MAGHSKFKNIMHRKGAQDKKRSKLFSKLSKEITVAAKLGGSDLDSNPRLRLAVNNAKSQSMPKDNIDRAIKKSEAGDDENYEEIRYEGFGPGGIALIVDTLTDNRNRTASNVRAIFSKRGGNLGEVGSVNYMFTRAGQIIYKAEVTDADSMFEAALEAGAENVESDDETHEVTTAMEDLHEVNKGLEDQFGEADTVQLIWSPNEPIEIDFDQAEKIMGLIEALEDDDDVQEVTGNFSIPEDVMEKLSS